MNTERPGRAAALVVLGALLLSLVPLAIHMASHANPFLFSVIAYASLGLVLLRYLRSTTTRLFADELRAVDSRSAETLRPLQVFRYTFGVDPEAPPQAATLAVLRKLLTLTNRSAPSRDSRVFRTVLVKLRTIIPWLWLPILWLTVARLDYVLFMLSIRHLDTAVSTALYEVWPIVMVLVLARLSSSSVETRERSISIRKRALMFLAFIGLAIVVISQNEVNFEQIVTLSSVIGIVLALSGGVCGGLSASVSIHYGDLLQSQYSEQWETDLSKLSASQRPLSDTDVQSIDSAPSTDRLAVNNKIRHAQGVWFALVGLMISCLTMVPLNLLLFWTVPFETTDIAKDSHTWIVVALFAGVVAIGGSSVSLRHANLYSSDLGVNSLFFMTPIFSFIWLSIVGIELSRLDLLWIGAALVFSMNGLIESNPDEEPDYDELETERPWGTRLGFTSLVLSLWTFGSFIFLRDEISSESWLEWTGSEYWTVVSLSATIFALIFGFRVARLTSRLAEEDKNMLLIFRKFERLVRNGIVPADTLDEVRRFDTSRPNNIATRYEIVRGRIRDAYMGSRGDEGELFDLQNSLDVVCHSKQQGKDFSELISIFVFACVTVVLGLLARPSGIDVEVSGWEGFLTETFTTLFVSVIVFLAFHLVDMRRDRQIPLVVPVRDSREEYALFFRYRQELLIANLVSVLVMLFLVGVFAALLYSKWL